MSLYVIEREEDPFRTSLRDLKHALRGWYPIARPVYVPEVRDCNEHDGEWPAFVRLPHEHAAWEGYDVPVFEGDVERREWEERRRR